MLPIKPDYIIDFGGDKKDYSPVVNYLTDRNSNEVNLALKTCANVAKVSPIIQITFSKLYNLNPDKLVYSAFKDYADPTISLSGAGTFVVNISTQFTSFYDNITTTQITSFKSFLLSTNSNEWRAQINTDGFFSNTIQFTLKVYKNNTISTPVSPADDNLKLYLTCW